MNDWAEFRHFRYLLEIVKQEGFRAAAESLHTAQPNLSAQAKQFQDLSAIHLFRRCKDGRIKLTETGVAFGPIAQGLLDARDEAIAALIAIERGEIRTLRFGSTSLIDPGLFHTCCQMHKEIVPECPILPTHGDMPQLEAELAAGEIDAAVVTLPVNHSSLCVEVVRRERLVVCLRGDHTLAAKPIFQPPDLEGNLTILYHPEHHFHAHQRHREYLKGIGINVESHSRANHPIELRELVKRGYGFALVREGSKIDNELTTRPVAGVDWPVSVAIAYNQQRHPKTIPVLIRHLRRELAASARTNSSGAVATSPRNASGLGKRRPRSVGTNPDQMRLLG
ncbi:MAG TPA: LysR family transcriptional regulator [Acidobacteriaceae bacterium]|jgi:DNA-binding transcriptional LysR family regulator|nr:LysR family transcriptional regulator [Acidobacteriaceae bacterium]